MRCAKALLALPDYLRRALPDRALARVERHLGGCAACRRVLEEERSVDAAISSYAERHRAPEDPAVLERERLRIRNLARAGFGEPVPVPARARRLLPLAAAAAAVLAAGAALFLLRGPTVGPVAPGAGIAGIREAIQDDRTLERLELVRGALEGDSEAADDLNGMRFVVEMALNVPGEGSDSLDIIREEAEAEDALEGVRRLQDSLREAGRADLAPSLDGIRQVIERILGVS